MKPPFKIRDPKGDDLAFVLNSWLKSARSVGPAKLMTNETYYGGFRDECVRKLDDGYVLVACNPEDEDQIYGWIAASNGVIHYLYVKLPFRNYGIGKALVRECVPQFTMESTSVSTAGAHHSVWARKYNLQYDPYSWQTKQS